MPFFQVEVNEVRSVRVLYTVEADDAAEALDLAECGETEREEQFEGSDVMARHPDEDTLVEMGEPASCSACDSLEDMEYVVEDGRWYCADCDTPHQAEHNKAVP